MSIIPKSWFAISLNAEGVKSNEVASHPGQVSLIVTSVVFPFAGFVTLALLLHLPSYLD